MGNPQPKPQYHKIHAPLNEVSESDYVFPSLFHKTWKPKPNTHNYCNITTYHPELIHKSLTLFHQHGYKVENINSQNYKKYCNVEYHHYYSGGSDQPIQSYFSNHCDNEGPVDYPVHTCIFYLENTFTSGGDLIITDKTDIIDQINVKYYNVVLLSGDTYHEITPMMGKGSRKCFVVQIKSI